MRGLGLQRHRDNSVGAVTPTEEMASALSRWRLVAGTETACRVGGAVAGDPGSRIKIRAPVQMGEMEIDRDKWRWANIARTRSGARRGRREGMGTYLDDVRKQVMGSAIVASGVPAGLGAPIYGKLTPI